MESRTVLFDGELFECESFFDLDSQQNGIDIYYLEDKRHIGYIEGVELPDEEDEEMVTLFEEMVCAWLKMQDINYTME